MLYSWEGNRGPGEVQEFFLGGGECHCQGPPLPFPLPVPIPLQIGSSPVPLKVDLIHCLPLPLEVGPHNPARWSGGAL